MLFAVSTDYLITQRLEKKIENGKVTKLVTDGYAIHEGGRGRGRGRGKGSCYL